MEEKMFTKLVEKEIVISEWFKIKWEIADVPSMKGWKNIKMIEQVQSSDYTKHAEKTAFSFCMRDELLSQFLESFPKVTDL